MPAAAIDPERLLAGPRGRRVCWALLAREGAWWWRQRAPESAGPIRLAEELSAVVERADIAAIAASRDPGVLWEALEDSVYAASYWQEPDDADRRLSHPAVSAALEPVAEALGAATAAAWWTWPLDPLTQNEVTFELPERADVRLGPVDPRAALERWRADTIADERRAEGLPDDPRRSFSGAWWSTPALQGLTRSTRALGSRGPVGLSLVEDAMEWASARCQPLQVRSGASVLEIRSPEDWSALVERYPLAVPRSRRHDWFRSTGQDAPWAIPDYRAVAADHDAVHVSVEGYLATAGRALPAGEFSTVLAGWNPDETWWLTPAAAREGDPEHWRLDAKHLPPSWTPGYY
jgi:hypothetical protein